MGPYEVSFDLGDVEYNLSVLDPTETGSLDGTVQYIQYVLNIEAIDPNLCILTVSVDEVDDIIMGTEGIAAIDINKLPSSGTVYSRNVDGKNTFMAVDTMSVLGTDLPTYTVIYPVDWDAWTDLEGNEITTFPTDSNMLQYGQSTVSIVAIGNWDTTCQFLNTVHVERISE